MRCIVRSRFEYITLVLCRERRKGIIYNSVSRHRQENGFLRRIRLQIMRSSIRGTASQVTDISNLKWSDRAVAAEAEKVGTKGESAGDL